jgi:excisionase family DNA binding protein
MSTIPDDLIKPRRAAEILCVRLATIYRYRDQGKLRAWKRGAYYLFSEAEVRAMIQPVGPGPCSKPDPARASIAHMQAMEKLRKAGMG